MFCFGPIPANAEGFFHVRASLRMRYRRCELSLTFDLPEPVYGKRTWERLYSTAKNNISVLPNVSILLNMLLFLKAIRQLWQDTSIFQLFCG